MEVTATFDKASYRTGELINIDVTVKNLSDKTMHNVTAYQDESPQTEFQVLDYDQWTELNGFDTSIEPGASRTAKLSGYPATAAAEIVMFDVVAMANEPGESGKASISAPVTKVMGSTAGIAFADKNNNAQADPGEGLPNLAVTLGYIMNEEEKRTTTTGPDGAFAFSDIPAARYRTPVMDVDGWVVLATNVVVTETGAGDVRIRGVRTLENVLTPELKFTKDTYRPGELAHVRVTLTNSSDLPLTGIVANCNRADVPDAMNGGPGWGDLAAQGKGVTVPAKQTLTLEVSEEVPQISQRTGDVTVTCDFGYVGYESRPIMQRAHDVALVPGGVGTILATVSNDPDGDLLEPVLPGVAGVKVVLIDDRSCNLGTKVTDAQGDAEFTGLAAGKAKYSLYFYPPPGWMMRMENPRVNVNVIADEVAPEPIAAAPGEGLVPGLPAPSPACGQQQQQPPGPSPTQTQPTQPPGTQPPGDQPAVPAPRGKVVKLANTGVDVVGLGTAGVVFLLLGTGAVVASRRRGHPVLHRD